MSFTHIPQPALLEAPLGPATVAVSGGRGLRLTGLNSFHLDEGPDFCWLNLYRVLADGRQLDIPRDRQAAVGLSDGEAVVEWPATQDLAAPITVRYRTVEADSAVDVTFDVVAQVDMARFELFISSYFTPYYTPRYAVRDRRLDPEALVWYEKRWYAEAEDECWARDEGAEAVFADGRWSTGYPLNWQMGAPYAHPLMIQEHRYGHAIVTMARLRDCIGISGLNSYHNAQYFHLFGRDVKSGERLSTQVRMVLWTQWQDLQQEALECYGRWMEEN